MDIVLFFICIFIFTTFEITFFTMLINISNIKAYFNKKSRIKKYNKTIATVIDHDIKKVHSYRGNVKNEYYIVIKYVVNEVEYISKIQTIDLRYIDNTNLCIYYNPNNPKKCEMKFKFIEEPSIYSSLSTLVLIIVVLFILTVIYFCILLIKK